MASTEKVDSVYAIAVDNLRREVAIWATPAVNGYCGGSAEKARHHIDRILPALCKALGIEEWQLAAISAGTYTLSPTRRGRVIIMDAVLPIKVDQHVRGTPNESTIGLLERLLVAARSGDLMHFVGAGENADGTTECFCSADFKSRAALGAIEIVKHDVLHRI